MCVCVCVVITHTRLLCPHLVQSARLAYGVALDPILSIEESVLALVKKLCDQVVMSAAAGEGLVLK